MAVSIIILCHYFYTREETRTCGVKLLAGVQNNNNAQ